ncbi:MAG: cytochrome c [Sedimentitalea sp.]
MKPVMFYAAAVAAVMAVAPIAQAGGHSDTPQQAASKARIAQMKLYSFNLGLLGGMAKGAVDYDAAAAKGAAENLAALASMDQSRMWPQGSDSDTLSTSRALPAIWMPGSKALEKAATMAETSAALAAVAGDGLDQLRGGIGPVGQSCGGCHDDYRKPK